MRPVEQEVGNTIVTLDAGSLFETGGNIFRDFSEDGNLSLDDFRFSTRRHVSADSLDESVLGPRVEDTVPKDSRSVEVFRVNRRQEGAGVRQETFAVDLVEVDGSLSELDGVNGRQVVGSTSLVEEGHLSVTLEVAHSVRADRLVDGELLVVSADSTKASRSAKILVL